MENFDELEDGDLEEMLLSLREHMLASDITSSANAQELVGNLLGVVRHDERVSGH